MVYRIPDAAPRSQIAEERAPNGFEHIHQVMSHAELEEIAMRYKQTAGFTVSQVAEKAKA